MFEGNMRVGYKGFGYFVKDCIGENLKTQFITVWLGDKCITESRPKY